MKYGTERRKSLLFAPTQPFSEREQPICRHSEQCIGCPHAGHGFICWHGDDSCLRTDMEEIREREAKRK